MIARLKLLFVFLTLSNLGWFLYKTVTTPADLRNPNPLGFFYCLALFVVAPYLGYLLLFKLLAPRFFAR
jgi:hypothetical protein